MPRFTRFIHAFPVAIAAVFIAGFVAAACGGDDYGNSATTAAGAPSATAESSPAANTGTVAKLVATADTAKGKALTDGAGMTLYTFKPDAAVSGKSACTGACATTWPPLTSSASSPPDAVDGATGTFSLITRDDGAKQVAHNGMPLYRYAGDQKAGDTNGDGIGGVWFVALVTQSTTAASPTASSAGAAASNGSQLASPTSAPPAAATAEQPTPAPTTAPATAAPSPTAAPAQPTPTTDPYGGGNYGY